MTLPYSLSPRLRTLSKILTWLSIGIAITFVIVAFKDNMLGDYVDVTLLKIDEEHRSHIIMSRLKDVGVQSIAFAVLATNVLILLAIAHVFLHLSRGHVFSLPSVNSIRILGLAILVYAAIDILSYSLIIGLWTYDNPAGHRLTTISFSSFQGMMILMGGLFLVIGHIYTEAIRMAEENKQYV